MIERRIEGKRAGGQTPEGGWRSSELRLNMNIYSKMYLSIYNLITVCCVAIAFFESFESNLIS